MQVYDLAAETEFDAVRHVEKMLGRMAGGDFSVACWEAGQASPYHCHPDATEIYFCVSGGGRMRTPERETALVPGSFVVHPPGELHEYVNGPQRSVLFRVRYGRDMASRTVSWRSNPEWRERPEDRRYFAAFEH